MQESIKDQCPVSDKQYAIKYQGSTSNFLRLWSGVGVELVEIFGVGGDFGK